MRKSSTSLMLRSGAVLLLIGLLAAGCAAGETSGGEGDETAAAQDSGAAEPAAGGDEGEPTTITFLIAPDPLLDWMTDQGIVEEYEEKYNIVLETTQSWDEFTFFAGGHGDIVSLGTLELPILEEETGVDTVTFGRYNSFRSTPAALCEKGYETLEDVPEGSTIGVNSAVSSTVLWDIYSREVYGYPFEVGNPDSRFELLVEDHFVLPELINRGDTEAGVIIPEAAAEFLVDGEICYMYDGRASWEVFAELLPNPDHKGVLSNGFTSTKTFYEENPEAIAAFLAMWEAGLISYYDNIEEIVSTYPQHFAVENETGIQYITEYLQSEHDYYADSMYLNEEWIENELTIYDLMKEHGRMEEDAEIPEFVVVEPLEGEPVREE